ncbi:Transcription factor [Aspergillus melleus]|uniref:Transcription factor n=1 Tax=Aspergillus melleus TaxID=138277 RepID=A0ACC3APR2_9EURO|nr:Transcription factor [Aspergillus melleus]
MTILPEPDPERMSKSRYFLKSESGQIPPNSAQEIFYSIKKAIINYKERSGLLQFPNVPSEVGALVAKSLAEDGEVERRSPIISFHASVEILYVKMPSRLHESISAWATKQMIVADRTGFFSPEEIDDIELQGSPAFDSFMPPHGGCYKEPDSAFIHVSEMSWPCVVFEVAVSESYPKLERDRNIWLEGGSPHVNAVLAMKFYIRRNKTVAGKAQIFRRGRNNNSPEQVIFPAPSAAVPQTINFFRGDFYPYGRVPQGRNAHDEWKWDMDQLRTMVTRNMAEQGLRPA